MSTKQSEALIKKYGEDHFKKIGSKGGKVKTSKGFAKNKELASMAGSIGGLSSAKNRRAKVLQPTVARETTISKLLKTILGQ